MNLTQHLRGLSPLDIYFARLLAGIAAMCEIYYIAERQYQMYKAFHAGSEVLYDTGYMQMHLRIGIALVLSSVCLWSLRGWCFYVSLAARFGLSLNTRVGMCGRDASSVTQKYQRGRPEPSTRSALAMQLVS